MNKNFKMYAICWFIVLALFNAICFITPNEIDGFSKFGGAFWGSYIMVTIAFIGQLICAYIGFKAENLKKLFFNMPYITISYAALILTIIVNAIFMAVPDLPNYVAIIVSLIILGFTAINIIMAKATSEEIINTDEKIKTKTNFIKISTMNVKNLVDSTNDRVVKSELEKAYDALSYSDPMSSDELKVEEAKITLKIDELANAIQSGNEDVDSIKKLVSEFLTLISQRNNKCKLLK